jgi:hypothetical protein
MKYFFFSFILRINNKTKEQKKEEKKNVKFTNFECLLLKPILGSHHIPKRKERKK